MVKPSGSNNRMKKKRWLLSLKYRKVMLRNRGIKMGICTNGRRKLKPRKRSWCLPYTLKFRTNCKNNWLFSLMSRRERKSHRKIIILLEIILIRWGLRYLQKTMISSQDLYWTEPNLVITPNPSSTTHPRSTIWTIRTQNPSPKKPQSQSHQSKLSTN